MVRVALCVLVAGCAPAIAVRAGSGAVFPVAARWVVTRPVLADAEVAVVARGGAIYAMDCGMAAHLVSLADGRAAWTRELPGTCPDGAHRWLGALDAGPVAAIAATDGLHVAAYDRAGRPRWDHLVRGLPRVVELAASADRVALCLRGAGGPDAAIELDAAGAQVGHHALGEGSLRACGYDAAGALWAIVDPGALPLHVDAIARPSGDGTWAVRLSGAPRFVALGRVARARVTATGFLVGGRDALAFVTPTGQRAWRLPVPGGGGCDLFPAVIAASPDRLLAHVAILCDVAHGTGRFGDVAIEDTHEPEDHPVDARALLVELAMPSGRALAVREVTGGRGAAYLADGDRLLAYGAFTRRLGLGTLLAARVEWYTCERLPPAADAAGGDAYPSRVPRCRTGYEVVPVDTPWPFVAELTWHEPR